MAKKGIEAEKKGKRTTVFREKYGCSPLSETETNELLD
jgi:hypothetical protein